MLFLIEMSTHSFLSNLRKAGMSAGIEFSYAAKVNRINRNLLDDSKVISNQLKS